MLRTEGIVLKEMRYRDTSKILSIYTRKHGKISVMARGAYKPRSRVIANSQPFSYNEFQLYKGKSFYYLNQGDLINSFYPLRERIERVAYGQYMLELMDKSLPEEQDNEKLFLLLLKGLEVLSSLEEGFLKFIIAYELKFISFLGYRPFLNKCVLCGNKDIASIKYSIEDGGIVCSDCYCPIGIEINREIYCAMGDLLFSPLDRLENVSLSQDSLSALHHIIVDYILYNIDRKRFNSLKIMESLEKIQI